MKFTVRGNYLGSQTIKSKKSNDFYKVVKVLVGDDKFDCFTSIELETEGIARLEEVNIEFDLTTFNNNYNLGINSIRKVK